MRKKILLTSFCFIISFLLYACTKDAKRSTHGDDTFGTTVESDQEPIQEDEVGKEKQEDTTDDESMGENTSRENSVGENTSGENTVGEYSTSENTDGVSSSNEVEKKAVRAQIQVYEGTYFDESVYLYLTDPDMDSSSFTYCIITISDITDTSFQFEVNEITYTTEASEVVIPKSTAIFIDDGTKAAYYGEDITLSFEFPGEAEDFPKYIEISGFEKLEGNSYMNNTIPGHESG